MDFTGRNIGVLIFSVQVRTVLLENCPDLMLKLDLTGVNPKDIPFNIRNSGQISLSAITFEQQFSGSQILTFNLHTVTSFRLEDLTVTEAIQVRMLLTQLKMFAILCCAVMWRQAGQAGVSTALPRVSSRFCSATRL